MSSERSTDPVLFFSKAEKAAIIDAIQDAEKKTSGEIRVHLERKAREDILSHAGETFERLGMQKTRDRNGVLIFLGVYSKRFAIIGDEGIHAKVPDEFWNDIVEAMVIQFKKNRFADGVVAAIQMIGEKLRYVFPYERDDVNELSDEISFGRSL